MAPPETTAKGLETDTLLNLCVNFLKMIDLMDPNKSTHSQIDGLVKRLGYKVNEVEFSSHRISLKELKPGSPIFYIYPYIQPYVESYTAKSSAGIGFGVMENTLEKEYYIDLQEDQIRIISSERYQSGDVLFAYKFNTRFYEALGKIMRFFSYFIQLREVELE